MSGNINVKLLTDLSDKARLCAFEILIVIIARFQRFSVRAVCVMCVSVGANARFGCRLAQTTQHNPNKLIDYVCFFQR